MFLLACAVLLIAGLAVIAIRLARAAPGPAALPIRHCSLVAWVGVAVIALSGFLPWWKVTEAGYVRAEGSMVEEWPLALLPLVVAGAWLLRPELELVQLGLVAAATGVAVVLVFELWIALLNWAEPTERHHAEIGVHLALVGYLVIALATAAAERTTLRARADS